MNGLMHAGLQRAARERGGDVAVRMGEEAWTFADLDAASDVFASYLVGAGVRPGGRVAVMLTNRVEFVMALHGISKAGAAMVSISPAWKAAEVAHAVALTAPVHAVADGGSVALLAGTVPAVTDVDDSAVRERAFSGRGTPFSSRATDASAESVLVFSSGTTGMPKAVRHTHHSMGCATRHWVDVLALGPEDRFQVATPPTHILGLLNLLAAAEAGAAVRLHGRFDLDEVLRRIESDRITIEMAVAPIALAMANHPDIERYDLSSLRYIMWGATPVTASVAETVTRRTGVRWVPAYGASELPVLACNPAREPERWRLDSAGLPPSGVELRVVDLDTGTPLPPGEVGEIQARSESCMTGYLPESETPSAFADGWYRTGDVGWLEAEGWVHLTDRSKEMIKVNGFQVAPAELEGVLLAHPAVLDCAVFGIPDARTGEAPVAAVQLAPGSEVAEGELAALVAGTLATYKQLRHVVVVDAIPRLPSGKALRRTLRDEWTRTHQADGAPADGS